MTYLFYSIRASPAQMRCEPSCTAYLFPHFCHRFAPPKTTSLPKKFFSFAVKGCIMLLECAAFCFLREIFVICQQSLPLQFIPARGRKPIVSKSLFNCQRLQFIPARGRKLYDNASIIDIRDIAIYPREGTKTFCGLPAEADPSIAIYPREGTKTCKHPCKGFAAHIAIYPREGTKTCQSQQGYRASCNCNLSPRGDENSSITVSCVSIV